MFSLLLPLNPRSKVYSFFPHIGSYFCKSDLSTRNLTIIINFEPNRTTWEKAKRSHWKYFSYVGHKSTDSVFLPFENRSLTQKNKKYATSLKKRTWTAMVWSIIPNFMPLWRLINSWTYNPFVSILTTSTGIYYFNLG